MSSDFSWSQIFGDRLVANRDGKVVTVPAADLQGKHVGIYFSAHWCGPCRKFTPSLAHTYRVLQEDGKPFEVVFVSLDRQREQFDEYFSDMPWLAVPFEDEQLRNVLIRKFRVMGIPHLTMMAPDSTILSSNARAMVATDMSGSKFPWAGASEPGGMPIQWMMLALFIFFIVNHFYLQRSKAAANDGGGEPAPS